MTERQSSTVSTFLRRLRVRVRVPAALAVAVALLALAGAAGALGEEEAQATKAARGKVTYRIYCSNCHGAGGEGDGRLASLLNVRPADLTRLTEKDGTFPADEVSRSIDGRQDVLAHGMQEMPVWGDVFQEPEGSPEGVEAAREKIADLVAYVESIQKPRK